MIDLNKVQKNAFNLISSGCGTGKSYFVMHHLQEHYPDVAPEEIIIVTSRSITADQQSRDDGVTKYKANDKSIINYWNGDDRGNDIVAGTGDTRIMTYDKFIHLLDYCNSVGRQTLCKAKIVVFDECHSIFSDEFIKNLGMVRLWIHQQVRAQNQIIMGLTATPDIVLENSERWGVRINRLNDEVFMRYKAKQMICANLSGLPQLIRRLPGKTLVMCKSIAQCEELAKKIPHSFVLVSGSNTDKFTPEMSWLRDYITKNSVIPDKRFVPLAADTGRWEPIKVLIATSTVREGFNLIEASGVKNIVSCLSDDLHVVQIAGRARYNLDNLVVVATTLTGDDRRHPDGYMQSRRREFNDFMSGLNDGKKWFASVSHIVNHDLDDVQIFSNCSDAEGFKLYLNDNWVSGTSEEIRLYSAQHAKQLIDKCIEYKVTGLPKSKVSWQKVLKLIEQLGYRVESGRAVIDGKRVTYKTIWPAGGAA